MTNTDIQPMLLVLLIVLIFLTAGCARCGNDVCENPEQRRGSCPLDCEENAPGDVVITLESGRRYFMHIPAHVQDPAPVVLAFHGGGGSPQHIQEQSMLNEKSDREGFIAVYPEGTGPRIRGQVIGTWNAGRCCGKAMEDARDDVAYTRDIIESVAEKAPIDRRRIYATGHSNGALMAYRLACDMSEEIAAIAAVGAHDAEIECNPTRKVPVIHFHGMNDESAMYNGGTCGKRAGPGWSCRSVPEYLAMWASRNECGATQHVTYQKGEATCMEYDNCKASVVLCTIQNAGHTWPGGQYAGNLGEEELGAISPDINANDEMWKFFSRFVAE